MLCERFFFRCYWWRFRLSLTVKVCRKSRLMHRSQAGIRQRAKMPVFSQSINYPASSVNMADDQNISAQIRGKIKNYAAAGKVQQGRLVVNGASMPQRIESDGSFARPYIFTEGSNSVQVISPDGQSRQKNAVLLNAGYRNDSCTFTAGSLVGYGQYRPRPSRCYARWRTRPVR